MASVAGRSRQSQHTRLPHPPSPLDQQLFQWLNPPHPPPPPSPGRRRVVSVRGADGEKGEQSCRNKWRHGTQEAAAPLQGGPQSGHLPRTLLLRGIQPGPGICTSSGCRRRGARGRPASTGKWPGRVQGSWGQLPSMEIIPLQRRFPPWPGVSVGFSVIPCTKRSQVPSLVRVRPGGNPLIFLSQVSVSLSCPFLSV